MGELILIILSTIIITVGVVSIYDARTIALKMFSSGETNEITKILKIVGFIISLMGLGIIYILLK